MFTIIIQLLLLIVKIELLEQPYDPYQWVQSCQQQRAAEQHDFGATAIFFGTMRDFNEGDEVKSMVLEHYPEMTDKYLRKLAQQAIDQWGLIDIAIAHRVGAIHPGEAIVCVAVWSSHRKEAYEANRMVMEALKSQAPFWKKETLETGSRWVEKNTPGF